MDPINVTIRDARPGDGDACARLWVEFGRALAQRMPETFFEPDPDGLAAWFEEGIAASEPLVLRALAEHDGDVVGLVHAFIRPATDAQRGALMFGQLRARATIDDIVVAERVRGRGVGAALVRSVEGWARARGAEGLLLNSDPDGPARRFYEGRGFTISAAVYTKALA